VEIGRQDIDAVGPQRIERAMGQVQDPRHAEDEGEPHRQHGVDRADDGAIDKDLNQVASAAQFCASHGGLIILPVATLFGHTTSRLPSACHCTKSSLTKPGPSLTSCRSSNWTRPRVPTKSVFSSSLITLSISVLLARATASA